MEDNNYEEVSALTGIDIESLKDMEFYGYDITPEDAEQIKFMFSITPDGEKNFARQDRLATEALEELMVQTIIDQYTEQGGQEPICIVTHWRENSGSFWVKVFGGEDDPNIERWFTPENIEEFKAVVED